MAEGIVMKTSMSTESNAAIGLMNLDNLHSAQIGVAAYLEQAYVSLVDYPGLFTKVHLSASNAQMIHQDTAILMQDFATLLNHLIESMIPTAVRGIQQKNVDILKKVCHLVMEKADGMTTSTQTIAKRYLVLRDDISTIIREVKIENTSKTAQYETCLKERVQHIESAGKAEEELRKLTCEYDEIHKHILQLNEKLEKLKSWDAKMSGVVCTTQGAETRYYQIKQLSDTLHETKLTEIDQKGRVRRKRMEVNRTKSQVEKELPKKAKPADPKYLNKAHDLVKKIPLYLHDIARFWGVLHDEIKGINESISIENPDKVHKLETQFGYYKTEHLELTRQFSKYLHNISDIYKFLTMPFDIMKKMTAMNNGGELDC